MSESNEGNAPDNTDAPRSMSSRLSRLRNKNKDREKDTELVAATGDPSDPDPQDAAEIPGGESKGTGGEDELAEEKADVHPEPKEQSKAQASGKRSGTALSGMETGGPVDPPQDKGGPSPIVIAAPLSVLEPHRTDPMHNLRQRHKKLERIVASNLPEMHFSGQLVSGQGIIQDSTEGCCCRWKIEYGNCWQLLGGEISGQTQIAYSRNHATNPVPFNHPIDLHVSESGIQGKGSPCLMLQCYRLDWHGRLILAGYGFTHLPTTPGLHNLEVPLWIPLGSTSQELDSYFLGRSPALVEQGPIYETAWKERCRLVTAPAGTINAQLFVVTRHMYRHSIDNGSML